MSRQKIIRSRAPLRIGLAGGGTDTSPYSDQYGGALLNATISLYAHATIEPLESGMEFCATDRQKSEKYQAEEPVTSNGPLQLLKGVASRIMAEFSNRPLSFRLTTRVDAPPGSGLGSSSTLVAAIIGAFSEWLKLPLGEYDIAKLAYEIERIDMGMAGGKQDQYAATFGGFNFMEFGPGDKVVVNPLRVRRKHIHELEHNLLLYDTESSRISSEIITRQTANIRSNHTKSVEAMHHLKDQALKMKEVLLTGKLSDMGELLDYGWRSKKDLAAGITNGELDKIYAAASSAGATGGKISGAGGGGFMVLYCPGNTRNDVVDSLRIFGGRIRRFNFTGTGLTTWSI